MTKQQHIKQIEDDAASLLNGRTIVAVRYMTDDEMNAECWHNRSMVIVLDNGIKIYASSDDEGNGAGAMFGASGETNFGFPVV